MTTFSLLLVLLQVPALQETPDDELTLLKSTAGSWRGTLTYRDFGTGKSVSLPTRLDSESSAGGSAIIWKVRFEDPGRTIENLDVATMEPGRVLAVRSFSARGVETTRHRITDKAVRSAREWTITATAEGRDDGKKAMIRRTWSLSKGVLNQRTEVRGSDGQWFVRNELRLERPTREEPNAQRLVGRWRVDLRPTPDASPYFKTMVIKSVVGGSVAGTFYDTDVANGHINTDWGAVRFAFTTGDGTGTYHTQGVLRGDRIEGTTHSPGREFLSYWTATRTRSKTDGRK